MPNWSDDEGRSSFGVLECKRCLNKFNVDARGEVPEHACNGGRYMSVTFINEYGDVEHHQPKKCSD